MELQKLYIIQNELRSDLIDVTANSSTHLKEISNHSQSKNNPYVDPKPYYKVILNCNDALKNFKIMLDNNRMSIDDFNKVYSDIGALRSWIYLQLGIQYGTIPYVTEAYQTVNEMESLAKHPKIPFSELLDTLIEFTESLPYKEVYAYPTGNPLLVSVDGNSTQKLFVCKPFLLGDLYLWKGNYFKAVENYAKVMNAENNNPNENIRFNYYKLNNVNFDSHTGITVLYNRAQDETSLVNTPDAGWRAMFGLPTTSSAWNSEWLWALPYSTSFKPANPMLDLCSPTRSYQIRPSQAVKDLWESQVQGNGIPYDARGRLSYNTTFLGDAITKFTDNGGKWGIYRTGLLHLRFSEAANRDGESKMAWAVLNIGFKDTYYTGTVLSSGVQSPASVAELNTMITPYPLSSPYYFDARRFDGVGVAGTWFRNSGIRRRAGLIPLNVSFQTNMLGLEDRLIDEAALETAFEGNRWSDLMRVALRRNDPAFLADRVHQKLVKSGNPNAASVRQKLMDPANWYLPFEW
jgi:tetratricopeptide (TPR) repeat protein